MMNHPHRYEIHIQGELSTNWSEWLGGMTVETKPGNESVLYGELPDQTALLGVLNMIHALNLTIIFVKKGGAR
jgi:hypothetical protein